MVFKNNATPPRSFDFQGATAKLHIPLSSFRRLRLRREHRTTFRKSCGQTALRPSLRPLRWRQREAVRKEAHTVRQKRRWQSLRCWRRCQNQRLRHRPARAQFLHRPQDAAFAFALGRHSCTWSALGKALDTKGGLSYSSWRSANEDNEDWPSPNPSSSNANAQRRPCRVERMVP